MNHEELESKRAARRAYNKRTGYAAYHKYEKTPNGFLMRLYRNMESRIRGIQKQKSHLYQGKYLLPREEFYSWAKKHLPFWRMYVVWVQNNYSRKLTPTVDRLDSAKGYELTNMEWVTHSENSRRGSLSRHKKVSEDRVRSVRRRTEFGRNDQTHSKE